MTLETQEKHDILLMIKTTAKNLRVTLSRKHLTKSRNQIRATKSLEYMFHYIKWRPTSVIKKHSQPSETDFSPPETQKTVPSCPPLSPWTDKVSNRLAIPHFAREDNYTDWSHSIRRLYFCADKKNQYGLGPMSEKTTI